MSALSLEVVGAANLDDHLQKAWQGIQLASSELQHPMASAAFMLMVARHRSDVRFGVIWSGSEPVGFFPFQRQPNGVGHPVGFRLNDYQVGIFAPDTSIDSAWMLKRSGLSVWHFDHLVSSQRCFASGHFLLEDSPYIDLSQGMEAYVVSISGRARWKSNIRNQERMARDLGPIRFEFQSADEAAFRSLLDWKTAQIQRHGRRCVFEWPWVTKTLEGLRTSLDPHCTGVLSALYAGDRLTAVHFGLRSDEILHWWITAYDHEFRSYSPGALLLVRVIEEAARLGIRRIDLGKGAEPYKEKLQSGATPLATGVVCSADWRRLFHKTAHVMQEKIRSSALAGPAKSFAYWLEARVNRRA